MYVRTPQASAWLEATDSADSLPQAFLQRAPRDKPKPQVIWPRKAFDGKLGRYIAVKSVPPSRPGDKELLLVAVANKSADERGPWWVRAETALSERDAAQWAREGF